MSRRPGTGTVAAKLRGGRSIAPSATCQLPSRQSTVRGSAARSPAPAAIASRNVATRKRGIGEGILALIVVLLSDFLIDVGGWVPRVRPRTRAPKPPVTHTASRTNPWHPAPVVLLRQDNRETSRRTPPRHRDSSFPRSSVGMPSATLRVGLPSEPVAEDAERPGRHSHAERGNEFFLAAPEVTSMRWCSARSLMTGVEDRVNDPPRAL